MKTKIQVVNDIQTTINDGGQNTALEVRNILIEIVDFVQDLSDLSSGNIDGLLKKLIQLENRLQLLWDNVGYDEKEGATIQVQIKRLRKEIIKLADQIAIIGTGGVVYNDKEIRDLIAVLRIDVDALLSLTQRPFHIWSPTPIVDKKSSASFWYSFKGNVDQVASFTFRFSVNNNSFSGINSSVSLEFEIPPIVSSIPANQIFETSDPAEMYSILPILFGDNTKKIRGILSESVKFPLSFVVPVTNKNDSQEMTKHLSMSFKFIKEGALQFLIVEFNYPNGKITQGDTLALGDEIFTTIQFHCPDFIFRKIK